MQHYMILDAEVSINSWYDPTLVMYVYNLNFGRKKNTTWDCSLLLQKKKKKKERPISMKTQWWIKLFDTD